MISLVAFITNDLFLWLMFTTTFTAGTVFAFPLRVVQAVITVRFVGSWKGDTEAGDDYRVNCPCSADWTEWMDRWFHYLMYPISLLFCLGHNYIQILVTIPMLEPLKFC